MTLELELNHEGGGPLYKQIAEQLITRISDGRLAQGARLPTVRHLGKLLNVSPLTVFNAYSLLHTQRFTESIQGCGTFVAAGTNVQGLAGSIWSQDTPESMIADFHRVMQTSDLRSMVSGGPDPTLFPSHDFAAACYRSMRNGVSMFEYSHPFGEPKLQNELSILLKGVGVECSSDEIMITHGATRAISLVTQALASPGDIVLVEEHTYLGMLYILRALGISCVAVPYDNEGPIIEGVEDAVKKHQPKFFFTMPNFQNPTGILMSQARRNALLKLSREHKLYIVEDDAFSRFAYDGPCPRPLKSQDKDDLVIYIDSFCKSLFPGARVGYILPPKSMRAKLDFLIRSTDLAPSPFVQRGIAAFIAEGNFRSHLRRVVPKYAERRDLLLRSLKAWMPKDVKWTEPHGGFCCWLTLPEGGSYEDLHQAAMMKKVAFAPGSLFCAGKFDHRTMRLTFGRISPEGIAESIAVLGDLIRQRM